MSKCENCYHKNVCIKGASYQTATDCKLYVPAEDVQEVKHGKWIFKEQTKLIATDKVAIKEGYCNVNNHNLEKAVMVLKKRIKVKKPFCSVCGYYGDDICDATPYCPNCGAIMDGKDDGNEKCDNNNAVF